MKNLVKFYVAILIACSLSVSAKEFPFPKYSPKMTNAAGCSCNGLFSSCAGRGGCVCSCGFFTCSCSAEQQQATSISISKEQFANVEKLAHKLNELNAKKALKHLRNIVESVRDGDTKLLDENRVAYLNEINKLDQNTKNELNEFIKSIGGQGIV